MCLQGRALHGQLLSFLRPLLLAVLASAPPLFATDRHWSGATDTNWATNGNWTGGTQPAASDNAVFDSTFTNQPSLNNNRTITGVWFTTGIGQSVTIGGASQLSLNGGTINGTSGLGILVDNSNSFTLTINCTLRVVNAQTWRNNSSNLFTIGGAVNTNGRALTIDGTGNTTVSGVMSGTGSLTKAGTGTLVLSGLNTYTGGTSINGGTLKLGINSALPNTGVTVSGTGAGVTATLDLNGFNDTIASLTLGGSTTTSGASVTTGAGTLTLGGGVTYDATNNPLGATISGLLSLGASTRTFTIGDSSSATADLTVSAVISGTGGLTKAGAGTMVLSGTNTYSGVTTINAGTLSVSTLANGGSNSNLGSSSNAATNLILNGGTLKYTGAAVSTDRLFSVGTSGGTLDASGAGAVNFTNTGSMGFNSQTGTRTLTLTGTNTGSNTVAAVIGDNSGATSLIKSGAGSWTLSAVNTYTGTTTVNAGTLLVTGSLASGSAVTVNNSGTVLGGTGTIFGSVSIASSGAILQAGTGSTGQTLTMRGAVTMGSGSIIQLALGGSGAHSTLAMGVGGSISFQSSQKFNFLDLGVTSGSTYSGIVTGIGSDPGTEGSWTINNQNWAYNFTYDASNGGEINLSVIAVPEPSTYGAGFFGSLVLIADQYRRFKRRRRLVIS